MSQALAGKLRKYRSDCRVLSRDLRRVIDDLKFQNSGGKIMYAIDFSEIHAYALPNVEKGSGFDLFFYETNVKAIQSYVLQSLFFRSQQKLILLEPYAVELKAFISRLYQDNADKNLRYALRAVIEARTVTKRPEYIEFEKLFEEFPTPELEDRFVSFLEENASSLRILLGTPTLEPLTRISELFNNGLFIDLKDVVEIQFDVDDPIVIRWNKELIQRKVNRNSPTSPLIDAHAIAQIAKANEALKNQNTRILLVTRSTVMEKVFATEVRRNLWSFLDDQHLLRHPRIFDFITRLRDIPPGDRLDDLQGKLDIIDSFIKLTDGVSFSDENELPQEINDALDRIKNDWKMTDTLEIFLSEVMDEQDTHKRWSAISRDELLPIIQILRDHEGVRNRILQRLEELTGKLEYEHDFVGLRLYFDKLHPEDRKLLDSKLRSGRTDEGIFLRTSLQAMPYELAFYTSQAKYWLESMTPPYTWQTLIAFFKGSFKEVLTEWDYEKLLVIALILGTLSEWELGELYCNRALSEAQLPEAYFTHEGLFFAAICKRKLHPTSERIIEGVRLLKTAMEYKKKYLGDSEYNDPRYLKEMATQVLLWNENFGQQYTSEIPSATDGLKMLDQAEALCNLEKDKVLLIQILNNRLFYLLLHLDQNHRKSVEAEFEKLYRLQSSVEQSELLWPAFILDTIAWGKWVLTDNIDSSTRATILSWLETAQHSHELERNEKNAIGRHLRAVIMGNKKIE